MITIGLDKRAAESREIMLLNGERLKVSSIDDAPFFNDKRQAFSAIRDMRTRMYGGVGGRPG